MAHSTALSTSASSNTSSALLPPSSSTCAGTGPGSADASAPRCPLLATPRQAGDASHSWPGLTRPHPPNWAQPPAPHRGAQVGGGRGVDGAAGGGGAGEGHLGHARVGAAVFGMVRGRGGRTSGGGEDRANLRPPARQTPRSALASAALAHAAPTQPASQPASAVQRTHQSGAPASGPSPVTMLSTPGGSPTSRQIWPSSVHHGCSGGGASRGRRRPAVGQVRWQQGHAGARWQEAAAAAAAARTQRGEAGQLGGLEHAAVAGGQRGGHLAGECAAADRVSAGRGTHEGAGRGSGRERAGAGSRHHVVQQLAVSDQSPPGRPRPTFQATMSSG